MVSSGHLLSLYQVHQLQFVRLQEKGQVQFSVIPNENDGKKIENISLEICSQIFQETRRIQDPVQLTDIKQKPHRQLSELEPNIQEGVL